MIQTFSFDFSNLSQHHAPVREGQVDNKHVRWSSKSLDLQEDVDHTTIAKEVYHQENNVGNT